MFGVGSKKAVKNNHDGIVSEEDARFKDHVWVPHEEKVWAVATKTEDKGENILVKFLGENSQPFETPRRTIHPYDPSHGLDLDDAAKMNGMHEGPLLALLLRRFKQDKIYTNVADVLVSVNPYKNIPLLYEIPLLQMLDDSDEEFEDSDGEAEEEETDLDKRPAAMRKRLDKPHVHSVADRAFRFMTNPGSEILHGKARQVNQSIIITGESGAGKTEASKYVMRYLITAAQILAGVVEGQKEEGSRVGIDPMAKRIEAVLLESNTVLEAFGNAKTLRNDNSSRFGKYIKLQYDAAFRLVGARTEHFLLEKSRLVKVDDSERSYHIFYQLCCGVGQEPGGSELKLQEPEAFKSIAMGGCVSIGDEVDDVKEFNATSAALSTLGFNAEEKKALWRVLAAILHMGNITFSAGGEGEGGGEAPPTNTTLCSMDSGSLISMADLGCLLGLDAAMLQGSVLKRSMATALGSVHEIFLNDVQSKDNLDGLVKHLYGRLFSWIVAKINVCHKVQVDANPGAGDGVDVRSFIGILDIFGFEIMKTNSFEQLCINFANEVLQRQFNQHIFVQEQQIYRDEGLDVSNIPFNDNQPIIDLISKKPSGLMPILEDQVMTGRKAHALNNLTDKKLLDLYHQAHHRQTPHPNYEKPRFENDQFILRHFAGSVVYDVAGFLEKNNDSLQDDLRLLMLDSSDMFVRRLIEGDEVSENGSTANGLPSPPPTQAHRRPGGDVKLASTSTVSNTFRKQLDELVVQLSGTEPHYIKCIKPNALKTAGGWSSSLVIQQLRYSGVLEVIRIRREAFPTRIAFAEFYSRFADLADWRKRGLPKPDAAAALFAENSPLIATIIAACKEICENGLPEGEFQIGTNKVFMKDDGLDRLKWLLQARQTAAATLIQSQWRALQGKRAFRKQVLAITAAQRMVRGLLARRKAARLREELRKKQQAAAIRMQSVVRMLLALKFSKRARILAEQRNAAATQIQRAVRGYLAKKKLRKAKNAAVALQCFTRGFTARKTFCTMKTQDRLKREREARKATKLQAMARMAAAKKALAKARAAATTIQSAVRRFLAVRRYKKAQAAVRRIQSGFRMSIARFRFRKAVQQVVLAQSQARRRAARLKLHNALVAVRRIQRAVRAFLRNRNLEKCTKSIFSAALKGDTNDVTAHITAWPDLLFVRNKWDEKKSFSTLLHAACASGSIGMVALLEPFPEDVLAKDRAGNCPIHAAAAGANYEILKYLARKANMDIDETLAREEEAKKHTRQLSRRKLSQNINVFKSARLERARAAIMIAGVGSRGAQLLSGSEDALLMAGFLKKRRETDRWNRRWCVLTESNLLYFHKKSDAQPSKAIKLSTAMLKKSDAVDFAFELHAPDLLDKKNKEGRLYFQAENEQELQSWLVPLRMVVGLYQFRQEKRKEPIEYLGLTDRVKLVEMVNAKGETALHMAASTKVETGEGGQVNRPNAAAMMQVAAWLIENGALPTTRDKLGQTALHVAIACNNIDVALVLARRGWDLNAVRKDGKKCIELASGENVSQLMMPHFHASERSPLQPPPEKLFGFTYMSFMIEKTTMAGTGDLVAPFLSVSVYNSKGQLSEPQQDIVVPSFKRPNYLWWAQTWHMRTPLETLGKESFVAIELRDQGDSKKPRTIAWGVFHLDVDEMNTRTETLNMYLPPVDPTLKRVEMAEVIIQGEVYLTKGTIKQKTTPAGSDAEGME